MNKIIILTIIAILMTANAYALKGAEVKASILRYNPTPAEQGNTVDVWIQLSNAGTKADQVSIKFVPEYPFSLPQGQSEDIDAGSVAATENKVIKFTLFVDSNAPNGDSKIKFSYKYSSVNDWIQLEAPISLETQNAALIVNDYSVTPNQVVPGQTATLELKIKNTGKIAVKNVDAGIDLGDGKFSTIGSGAKKRINYVGAGEIETITFQLASDTSTQVKVYSIPVSLAYQDERNKKYSDTAKISLVVNAVPEISLTVDSTKFDSKKKPGTVTLKMVNKGVINLKYVTLRLGTSKDYEILSSTNETYIGNLDSDDFETANFVIKPSVDSPKLNVELDFKDPYNVNFQKKYVLPVKIITDSDLEKGSSYTPVIIIILLIAGGAVYWKYYYNRGRK